MHGVFKCSFDASSLIEVSLLLPRYCGRRCQHRSSFAIVVPMEQCRNRSKAGRPAKLLVNKWQTVSKAYTEASQEFEVRRVSSPETRGARDSGVLLIRRRRSNVIKRLSSTFDLWVLCLMQRIMVLSTMQCRVSLRLWIPLQCSKMCPVWTW